MHYPKDVYWDRIKQRLKPNGKLIVDIRKLKDKNIVEEISDEFKSNPKMHRYEHTVVKWIDDNQDDTLGYRCVWTRKDNV
jgi:phosphopantetheinyl transferase